MGSMKFENTIYVFMNTLYGLFLVFRYDSDKLYQLINRGYSKLLKQAHRDLGVDNALLNKDIYPKKLDFTKSNNPDKDHIFVINDFIANKRFYYQRFF